MIDKFIRKKMFLAKRKEKTIIVVSFLSKMTSNQLNKQSILTILIGKSHIKSPFGDLVLGINTIF